MEILPDHSGSLPADISLKKSAQRPFVRGVMALVASAGPALALWLLVQSPRSGDPVSLFAWMLSFLLADALWFRAPAGRLLFSMSPALHMAGIVCLARPELLAAAWLSHVLAGVAMHRQGRSWAVFNGGRAVLVLAASGLVFDLVRSGLQGMSISTPLMSESIGLAAACIVHWSLVTFSAALLLAAGSGEDLNRTLRERILNSENQVGLGSMYLMAPMGAVTFHAIGLYGLVLFLLPLVVVRSYWKRTMDLGEMKGLTRTLVPMASAGHAAVSAGTRLHDHTAAVATELHRIVEAGTDMDADTLRSRLSELAGQVHAMSDISRGLMDVSWSVSRREPVDIGALARIVCERVTADTGARIDVVEPRAVRGPVLVDPMQIERLLKDVLHQAVTFSAPEGEQARKVHLSVCGESPDELRFEVDCLGKLPCAVSSAPVGADEAARIGGRIPAAHRIARGHGGDLFVEAPAAHRFRIVAVLRGTDPTRAAA